MNAGRPVPPTAAGSSLVLGFAAITIVGTGDLRAASPEGDEIYAQHCAGCHESGENRAPSIEAMQQLSAAAILESLTTGTMAAIGKDLPEGYAETVASFLGIKARAEMPGSPGACADAEWTDPLDGPRWIGWGADLANSRFQDAGFAGMDVDSVRRLRLRWVFGLPDSDRARGHPAVAGGRVFLGGRNGRLYALDARSGCTVWEFEALAEIRTAVLLSRGAQASRHTLYFGDTKANLYAVDADTGVQIWRTRVEDHPDATFTGSPTLHAGRLYVGTSSTEEFTGSFARYSCCTFRGSVSAIDASNGERVWKTHTIPEQPRPQRANAKGIQQYGPSGAAIWSAPTIDTRLSRVYVTTGDNYSDPATDDSDAIIAYDLDTGKRLWSQQFTEGDAYNMSCNQRADGINCPEANGPDLDFGSSAILVTLAGGRRVLLAGQKSGVVHAVDPDRDGLILWQRRAGAGGMLGGIQFGMAADDQNVYVAVSDYLGPTRSKGGGITAFRIADGEKLWHTPGIPCPSDRQRCSPAQSAAVTAIPGVVFSGALDGFIRAYSTEDGSVLWSYDTVRDYPQSVNGVATRGGSINGPGPAVVEGMLFVNSGYGAFGSIPGNAFLAFSVSED